MAPEGQGSTQGGWSQWLHCATYGLDERFGNVPARGVVVDVGPGMAGGTPHATLQATVQAWQATHFRRSVTMA